MNYYKVNLSHHCSFRVELNDGIDINPLVNEWLRKQNKGEAKSDRLHLYGISKVTEHEYNVSLMPKQTL